MIELRRGLDNLTRAKYTARFTTIKRDRELSFIIGLMLKFDQGKYSIRLKSYDSSKGLIFGHSHSSVMYWTL